MKKQIKTDSSIEGLRKMWREKESLERSTVVIFRVPKIKLESTTKIIDTGVEKLNQYLQRKHKRYVDGVQKSKLYESAKKRYIQEHLDVLNYCLKIWKDRENQDNVIVETARRFILKNTIIGTVNSGTPKQQLDGYYMQHYIFLKFKEAFPESDLEEDFNREDKSDNGVDFSIDGLNVDIKTNGTGNLFYGKKYYCRYDGHSYTFTDRQINNKTITDYVVTAQVDREDGVVYLTNIVNKKFYNESEVDKNFELSEWSKKGSTYPNFVWISKREHNILPNLIGVDESEEESLKNHIEEFLKSDGLQRLYKVADEIANGSYRFKFNRKRKK